MASAQITLTAGMVYPLVLTGPIGQVTVTMISGAAEVYITADGSAPATSTPTPNTGTQTILSPVVGAQAMVRTPSFGDHMAGSVTVSFLSAGTPTIEVAW